MDPDGKTATVSPVGILTTQVEHDSDQALMGVLLVLKQPLRIGHGEYRIIGKGALGRE